MRQRHLILSLILSCSGLFNLYSQVSYVKSGATGTGTSWADASGDLQAMLNAAAAGTQIWVAQGTYYPIQCSPCSHAERDTPFDLPEGVALYGGFDGTETNISERDWQNNRTLLSGDINQDDVLTNNTYTILYTRNVSAATLIDGFEVIDAYAENGIYDVYTRVNSGGGLYNDGSLSGGSSNPTIRNCKFTNHYGRGFGAAIMNYGGFSGSASPEIYDCEFSDNDASISGGAVYNSGVFAGETSTVFVDCNFARNTSNNGGAVYNQGSENGSSAVTFVNCNFENNTATVWGGAIVEFGNKGSCLPTYDHCTFISNSANQGGAIFNDGSFEGTCDPVYTNCNWTDNYSNLGGGAVYSQGPFSGQSNPSFVECTFTDNATNASGGALYHNGQEGDSNPHISNSTFTNNSAVMYGGGMYNFGKTGHSNPVITNSLFIRNKGNAAGAIYNYGGVNGESSPKITNCTFFKNEANVGPCVYNQAADPTGTVRPVVTNCIFWDNISISGFGLVFQNGYAQPSISHSIVQVADCASFNTDPNSTVNCGASILFETDPLFMDTTLENLHLEELSPAVDFGDNGAINATGITVDLDSVDRVTNSIVDFGVYEYQSVAYQAPVVISQSANASHCEGENETFYIVTSGTPPLSYQWEKNGQPINGATDSTYTLLALEPADAANYTCVVSSTLGDMDESSPIVLAVDPVLTVEVSISASATEICAGESIVFDATPTNGGNNPVYSWYRNGMPVGSSQNQITLNALADGDEVHCVLTSSANCTLSSIVNSSAIEVSVQAISTIAIALTASPTQICAGETVTFTTTPQNPGTDPVYTWFLNGTFLMTGGTTLQLATLNDGDEVSCQLTSSLLCLSNNPAQSDTVSIEVDEVLEAEIALTASRMQICSGEEIIFNAAITNGGSSPEYTWYVNSDPVIGNGDTLILNNLQNGDQVTCELISSYACLQQNPIQSDPIPIVVDDILEPEVMITASATEICAGDEVLLDAAGVNGGDDPEYFWFVNGAATGSNAAQLLLVNPMDGDVIHCLLVSSAACLTSDTVSSNAIQILVQESLEASITIETPSLSVCAGSEVLITTDVENEGAMPEYKWLINGTDQGINASALTIASLTDGDVVSCQLTSSSSCITQNPVISNNLTFAVQEILSASMTIEVDENSICLGDTVNFTALPVNAGTTPAFKWLLDGTTEIGQDETILSLDKLPVGLSEISCELTSSEACLESNPVNSNTIVIEVKDDASCTVATEQIPGINQVSVYPNPATEGRFDLLVEGNHESLDIAVRDVQGRLWYQKSEVVLYQRKQLSLDLGASAKGIFFVQLTSAGKRNVIKVMLF